MSKRKTLWWVKENLPVPPAWRPDHPNHPDNQEPEKLEKGGPFTHARPAGLNPTREDLEKFGLA